MLIDVLYTSHGKLIYSEIPQESPEYTFVEDLICQNPRSKHSIRVGKMFTLCFPQQNVEDFVYSARYFGVLGIGEAKQLLAKGLLPQGGMHLVKNFVDLVGVGSRGGILVFVCRVKEEVSEVYIYIYIYRYIYLFIIFLEQE